VRDKQSELGDIPRSARPILREWARVVLELDRNAVELEKSGIRRRGIDCRRLKRETKLLRFTMLKLDQRLQQLAGVQKETTDPFEALFAGDT